MRGYCANDNICNCKNTEFTGPTCNDYYQFERLSYIDKFIFFVSILIMVCTVILMVGILWYRHKNIIKAGKI